MSQKLPVDGFKWVKDTSSNDKTLNKFIKLIKNYDEESDDGYILEVEVDKSQNGKSLCKSCNFLGYS